MLNIAKIAALKNASDVDPIVLYYLYLAQIVMSS